MTDAERIAELTADRDKWRGYSDADFPLLQRWNELLRKRAVAQNTVADDEELAALIADLSSRSERLRITVTPVSSILTDRIRELIDRAEGWEGGGDYETQRRRIAELEARLAMAVEAARCAVIDAELNGHRIISATKRLLEEVIEETAPDATAFLARVKRQGAAEELRRMADELDARADSADATFDANELDKRATELEAE